ncbi:MAG: ATP-binding protein [Planctomycetota bacterium]|nr:MAG: ATP-binding protein [Planctomycetota bacterium]
MKYRQQFFSSADPQELPELRRRVQQELQQRGESELAVERAGLLVSELSHNAVEAAQQSDPGQVEVVVARDAEGLQLEVECDANQDLEQLQLAIDASGVLPSPDSDRGRGLWLVLQFSKNLQVQRMPNGNVRVRLQIQTQEG